MRSDILSESCCVSGDEVIEHLSEMNSIKNSTYLVTTLNSTLLRRFDKHTYSRPNLLNGINSVLQTSQPIHTTPSMHEFWEKHRKGGYNRHLKRMTRKELILDGLKQLKKEIVLWKEEVKEKLEMDPILLYRPGKLSISIGVSN